MEILSTGEVVAGATPAPPIAFVAYQEGRRGGWKGESYCLPNRPQSVKLLPYDRERPFGLERIDILGNRMRDAIVSVVENGSKWGLRLTGEVETPDFAFEGLVQAAATSGDVGRLAQYPVDRTPIHGFSAFHAADGERDARGAKPQRWMRLELRSDGLILAFSEDLLAARTAAISFLECTLRAKVEVPSF